MINFNSFRKKKSTSQYKFLNENLFLKEKNEESKNIFNFRIFSLHLRSIKLINEYTFNNKPRNTKLIINGLNLNIILLSLIESNWIRFNHSFSNVDDDYVQQLLSFYFLKKRSIWFDHDSSLGNEQFYINISNLMNCCFWLDLYHLISHILYFIL